MAGNELELVANAEHAGAATHVKHPVLVRRATICNHGLTIDGRHPLIDRKRFQTGVDDRILPTRRAHDLGIDE